MKNANRTRDLPACSAVPQPTAPLRAPQKNNIDIVSGTTSYLTFIFLITYNEEYQHEGLRNYEVGGATSVS